MDDNRFDALARGLAGMRSRRGVLKALGGAALGAIAGVAGLETAGANPPPKHCKYQGSNCKGNTECCTLNCCNRTCCGDGQTCANGQCVFATSTTPAPTTTTPKPTTTTTPKPTTTTTPPPNLCANVTCPPPDQCHVAGICDPSTGQCSNPAVADYTPCNDGNACTTNDQCFGGFCKGTAICPPSVSCDPTSGACFCAPGTTQCGARCVDTASAVHNCGACGHVCPGGDACNNPTCSGGACGLTPANENSNCVTATGGAGICSSGVCQPNPMCIAYYETCVPGVDTCCDLNHPCKQNNGCPAGPTAYCC